MDNVTRKKLNDIKRLMDGAASVGEAEAAAAAMQRLVMKHNLSAQDVEGINGEFREEYAGMWIRLAPDGKPGLTWRVFLVNALATYNFCMFVRDGNHGACGILIGQPSNQEAVKFMYDAAEATFLRLADEGLKVAKTDRLKWIVQKSNSMAWKNSFLMGVPQGLADKFHAERKQEISLDPNVSALVLVKDAELQNAVSTMLDDVFVKNTTIPVSDANAFRDGYAKGRAYDTGDRMGAGFKAIEG